MKQTINLYSFREAFRTMERTNFSYEGLKVLFDYLEEMECSLGEELELDVVALCCDYAELTYADIANMYGIEVDKGEDIEEAVTDYLRKNTMIVGAVGDDSIIYVQF